jgi:uncharacterized protein YukE
MTLSLTPEQANSKLQQIDELRDHAIKTMQQIEDNQNLMLNANWTGHSATTYGHTTSSQNDDMNTVIKNLNDLVEKATTHIKSVTTADN